MEAIDFAYPYGRPASANVAVAGLWRQASSHAAVMWRSVMAECRRIASDQYRDQT